MTPNLARVVPLGMALVLAGCATRPSTTVGAAVVPERTGPKPGERINDTCPISGRPVDPRVPGAGFDGYTIGLCSPVCTSQWDETPIAIKDHFLAVSKRKWYRRGLPQAAAVTK